jgi:hypothetical protein
MGFEGCDKHQLAGLDDRERGFSRPVEFEHAGENYRAVLRYETVRVATEPCRTQDTALLTLIGMLHARGYRQLKTQKSFRNGVYLGSQELWVEYPDPHPMAKSEGLLAMIAGWFRSRRSDRERP